TGSAAVVTVHLLPPIGRGRVGRPDIMGLRPVGEERLPLGTAGLLLKHHDDLMHPRRNVRRDLDRQCMVSANQGRGCQSTHGDLLTEAKCSSHSTANPGQLSPLAFRHLAASWTSSVGVIAPAGGDGAWGSPARSRSRMAVRSDTGG